jgi:hypothetical protein
LIAFANADDTTPSMQKDNKVSCNEVSCLEDMLNC